MNKPTTKFLSGVSSSIVLLSLSAVLVAEESSINSRADVSTGLSIGSAGIGITVSSTTDWHLTSDDHIQWRVMASGINANLDDDELELGDIEYNDGSYSVFALQGGLDWYPVNGGWADEIFVSTGLMYFANEADIYADTSKSFKVGNTVVSAGGLDSLRTEFENDQLIPYLSLGWGNKIDGKPGFDFQVEVGLGIQTSDPSVKMTVVDSGSVLNAGDLALQKNRLEDELGDAFGFATATVSYHY